MMIVSCVSVWYIYDLKTIVRAIPTKSEAVSSANLRNDLDQEISKTWAPFFFCWFVFHFQLQIASSTKSKHLFYTLLDKFWFMFLQISPVFDFKVSCEILLFIFPPVYSDVNKSFTIYALGFYIFIGQRPIILIPFFYFRNVSLTSKFRDAWRDDCCFGNWYGNSGIKQFRLTVFFTRNEDSWAI